MKPEAKKMEVQLGEKKLTFETGRIARQANGAVLVQQGETIVFGSACASPEASTEIDFLPLRVDYQEKFSSAGKTLGGFIKREGRPTERETLVCRLIDRPLRPMFPDGYYHEVQLISYVWSFDPENLPDVLAICAASAALVISDIPLVKPVGAVRVGLIEGSFVLNPTAEEMKRSTLDLVMAGTEEAILMIEGFCDFLPEEKLLEALEAGHEAIRTICKALGQWREELGRPKQLGTLRTLPEGIMEEITLADGGELEKALRIHNKAEREAASTIAKKRILAQVVEEGEEGRYSSVELGIAYKRYTASVMRRMVLKEKVRCDGRAADQIRPITIETALLPRSHGSALFTRGETQAVAVCTLGGGSMAQRFEDLHEEGVREFYLQYSFPPFSVGEVGRMGPPGRREVGHGKLAERALLPTLPEKEKFPYVVRLESNITESNGSSSMASVCGGSLAMMDAGVPIKRPVSGIAMGLILEGDEVLILSDILGVEDALGDMDFKVTGDAEGVTAFQMDIKVEGITHDIMARALSQARAGRIHILKEMLAACPAPKEMSKHAPRIETVQVKPSKIATIIGPGGKQIRAIIDETGVQIDINDDGLVSIAATSSESMKRAKAIINELIAEIEVGRIYNGKVKAVVPFGCFVEVIAGKEGLCHISELGEERVEKVEDVVKEGDRIDVKVLDINERGQIKLSRRAVLKEKA